MAGRGTDDKMQPTSPCYSLQLPKLVPKASPASAGVDDGEMQACYVQLQKLVPTVPADTELSHVQLLQHVIDYILDLEVTLDYHDHHHHRRSPSDNHYHQTGTSATSTENVEGSTTKIRNTSSSSSASSLPQLVTQG